MLLLINQSRESREGDVLYNAYEHYCLTLHTVNECTHKNVMEVFLKNFDIRQAD